MLNLSVPWGHVLALAVANFVLSWGWYSPLIAGKPFMKALGLAPDHKPTEADMKGMPILMANGFFSSLATIFVLQVLILSTNTVDFVGGATVGLLCAFGFALTSGLGTLWEKRSLTLVQIAAGLAFFSYALFGGLLAVWR